MSIRLALSTHTVAESDNEQLTTSIIMLQTQSAVRSASVATLAFACMIMAMPGATYPDTAARLIKIPLTSQSTQGAGPLGQPVISYYAPLSIGNPPKLYQVQFDVNFGDSFVPHYEWAGSVWNPLKNYLHYDKGFKCKDSSSCEKTDQQFTVNYQDVRLKGKLYKDEFVFNTAFSYAINNASNANVAAPRGVKVRQNFLAMSEANSGKFKPLPVDGFIGLPPQPQSAGSYVQNLLVSLLSAKQIDLLQFSIWFNPWLDQQPGGELVLGGIDPHRYQGQIYWHPLADPLPNHWSVNLQFVQLGGQIMSCYQSGCKAYISTAVNELYGPRADVERIYSMLNTSRASSATDALHLVDCRRISGLPAITLSIDGVPYVLMPSNYVRKTTDGVIFKSETCYVAILPHDEPKQWILGTNFLGAYYSTFDVQNKQIGFASLTR